MILSYKLYYDHAADTMTAVSICKMIPKELLSSPPRLSLLDEIAYHLDSWENLAPFIAISHEEQSEISNLYSGHYIIQKQQALRAWRRNLGDKATLESLIVTLCREAQAAVAERLKEIIGQRPVCIPIFGKYLHQYHKFNPNIYTIGEKSLYRFDDSCRFVDLILHELLMDENAGSTTKECSYKVVSLSDVLNNQLEQIAVLFEGVAGSGKTTLSLHICLEWAEGRLLQQFQLLIRVQLNDPKLKSVKCLADLIPDTEKEMRHEVAAAIVDEKGRGICILLEGLDEAPSELWNSLLPKLFAGKSLANLSFILTTRPGCPQVKTLENKVTTKVVIRGFSKESIVQFINDSNSNENEALIKKIENNPRLLSLCSLPINAVTIKFLLQFFKTEIPETQTGISKLLLCNFLVRHIQTKMGLLRVVSIENFEEDLQAFPVISQAFRKLSSLSYSAVIEKKRYFTTDDMDKAGLSSDNDKLGLLQTVRVTSRVRERLYCFPHLSFQEFLAAVHLTLLDCHQQVVEVQQLFNRNPLNPVLPLYAGLTCLTNEKVFKVLLSAIDLSLDDASIFAKLQHNPSRTGDPRRKALAFFNCLYECHNDKLMASQIIRLKSSWFGSNIFQVSMTQFSMTPADCLALGYFVKYAITKVKSPSLLHVHLGKCSDFGIASFLTEVTKGIQFQSHEEGSHVDIRRRKGIGLFLYDYVPQDKSSPVALKEFLRGSTTSNCKILQLVIGSGTSREIMCVFLKSIAEGMAGNLTCISTTLMFPTGLSQSYIHYILLMLSPLNTVAMFYLSGVNIQNCVHLVAEALKFSNIRRLSLNSCNIDDFGLETLGKGISKNSVMIGLDVKSNHYTVRGALNFLRCLISKEALLWELRLDDEVYAALPSEEEYHRLILHIISFRMILKKSQLFINCDPGFLVDAQQEKVDEYSYKSAGLFTLPPKYTRRYPDAEF